MVPAGGLTSCSTNPQTVQQCFHREVNKRIAKWTCLIHHSWNCVTHWPSDLSVFLRALSSGSWQRSWWKRSNQLWRPKPDALCAGTTFWEFHLFSVSDSWDCSVCLSMQAVLHEAQRMASTVPLSVFHCTTKNTELLGYSIPEVSAIHPWTGKARWPGHDPSLLVSIGWSVLHWHEMALTWSLMAIC